MGNSTTVPLFPLFWFPRFASSYLQQLSKLVDRKPGITNDTAEGEGINWVVACDGQDARAIGHKNLLALALDDEPSLGWRANHVEMVDAGNFDQG